MFQRNRGCTKIQKQVMVPQVSDANMDKISKTVNSGVYKLKLSTSECLAINPPLHKMH
jgi:hypothetical protein